MTEDDKRSARFGSLKLLKVCLPWRGIEELDAKVRGPTRLRRSRVSQEDQRVIQESGKT